jgi:acyl-CoA synthetase (AMP-forming)/AMP-acid ligase II
VNDSDSNRDRLNTADYLLQTGEDTDVALIAGDARYTYGDVRQACARMAGELLAAGVGLSDRVGLLGSNSLFWVATYLAALKLRAIAAPFPPASTPNDMSAMGQLIACKVVCVEKRLLGRFSSALPRDVTIITDDVLAKPGPQAWPSGIVASNGHADVADPDAAFMFTSGTTARARAVRVTHRNIQANTDAIINYLELTRADRMLVVLPFCYCFGTSLLHTHLRAGGSLVLCNSFVYPEIVLDLMDATECTGFAGVPSTFQTLLRNSTFPQRQLKALRKIQQAGGKLPTVLIEELMAAAHGADVFVMYGQTEATARLSYLPPDLLRTKMGSIGRGVPGVTLRVLGESGEQVRPGEVGEIYAWGDSICPGYYNESEASAQKFVGGALRTGDLATVDDEGFIYIADRKSDFIKSYGFRVSSQQVEACVLELADVVAAAAIGEPDLVRGEAIKVFITLRDGSSLIPRDVIAHCIRRLAQHMVPKEVVVVDQLPMNAHGKVVKAELRARLASQSV